ncbi:alpha-D-xyloside xylohydrolase [Paenibacillus turicensis]|uniref:Alpha-D-xyloside xylohydrolase n=1 Tax=Paenibacillus turicensis TaxID=160487 RepID=A0ABS4FMF6_9BACL|nr:TIM-barrel domain-containing protein [Paenibacillus turicensis]MBP1903767.1 alpha-D-xyloside xylohydrolase [Paenibacillus turicensis]
MGKITLYEDKLVFERKDELTVIEAYGENCLRCRSTKNARLSDEAWTLLAPPSQAQCVVTGNEQVATITNGFISATIESGNIWHGGIISYFREGKQILRTKFEGDYTTRNMHREGDHYQVKVIFEANEGEHFYGLGQEQEDQFDRKGSTCNLLHYNTKSALPVVYSSLGYGFFWNNPSPGRCELTNNHTLWLSESAYQADYLVYAGETPADVMKIYCDLTGYASAFPAWAGGFWQCKLRYETQEDLLEVAREYKRRNIPIDAIVIDYFHWTEQGEWRFDPTYWPDPKAMCDELLEMNIRPIVSIWPTINPKSENYLEMSEANMLVRTENGQYGTFDFYGQQTFIDPMNPKTAQFVWDKVKQNYYDYGIKDFWLDEAEPEVHPQQFGHLKFYLGNGAQTAMLYPYYYSKMFYEGLQSEGETEIISLTRAAYPGSQKYGAAVWNGDIMSTFEALRMSVKSGLSMAMSGIPWWNSDIGGFFSGDIESSYFRELIVRWFQFGLFSPIMRLHGARTRSENHVPKHPGIIEQSGGDNEIWAFGDDNYPILKKLIELRERMKPYTKKYMDIAEQTGKPIMRPMFFDFYADEVCYTLEDQYMYGEDILFAPIVNQGQTDRDVYLPEGRWVNVYDRNVYEGQQYLKCHAELDQFIAFVKEGSEALQIFDDLLY